MPKASQADEKKEAVPRPRRWRRRLLWLAALLVLVLLLAPLALALGPVRNMLAGEIGDRLGRRVEIGSAFAFWGKGIDLEAITVHSPDGFDGPLATVRRIHTDLDVIALLTGRLSATVRVVEPHVTLRRNARDEGNADGVLAALQGEEEPDDEEGAAPALKVIVLGGRVEAVRMGSVPANRIDDIQIAVDLAETGGTKLSLNAVAVGAATDGSDARIQADATLDRDGAGPIAFEAPPLDLGRLAGVLESVVAVADLAGEVTARGKGTLQADGRPQGTLQVGVRNFRCTFGGSVVRLQRLRASADVAAAEDASDSTATVDVRISGLHLQQGAGPDRGELREPEITLKSVVRYDPEGGSATITTAQLQAGKTASIHVPEPLQIQLQPSARFAGRVQARVDLGRLGRLRDFVPLLASLQGGTLEGHLGGHSAVDLDADAELTVRNLRLGAGALATDGYEEGLVKVGVSALRDSQGTLTITLKTFESTLLRTTRRKDSAPLKAQVDSDGRFGLDGAFDVRIDLPALSRLMGSDLGLGRNERIAGSLRLAGTAKGTAESMTAQATATGTGLRPPRSWGSARRPATLQAVMAAHTTPASTVLRVTECRGLGIRSGQVKARLARDADSSNPTEIEASFQVDLAGARTWFGRLVSLGGRKRVAGLLRTDVKLSSGPQGRQVDARAQVDDFVWQGGGASAPVRRARVLLEARGDLAEEGGRHRFGTLKFTTDGLALDLGGATAVMEPDVDMDATLRLGGDAAKLAPLLSSMLGEGYEDLRGRGALSGSLTLRGSPAENARRLVVQGSLDLGAWSTGGVHTTPVKLQLNRPGDTSPLATTVHTTLNGGPTSVGATLTLGGETIPWRGNLEIKGADTSGVLVSKGLGRYLAFALPALLPAQAQQPVLSGRLDVNLVGSSQSLSAPALQDGLRANGSIRMTQGEIRQSTLFGGGGGSSLDRLVSALRVAVPEAGAVLGEASKAVTFTSLDSRFRVASRVVNVERVDLKGRRLEVVMTGRVDFEQRCGLRATVTLTGSGGRALAKVLPDGAIPMGISGTLSQPRVTPNVDLKKLVGNPVKRLPDLLKGLKKKKPKLPDIFK